jgi:hypothetical protein
MPNPSVKKLLKAIHSLNVELKNILQDGDDIALQIADIDYTTVTTDISLEGKLNDELENTTFMLDQVRNMKQTVVRALQEKVIRDINTNPPGSSGTVLRTSRAVLRTRSLSLRRSKSNRFRKTRHVKSI